MPQHSLPAHSCRHFVELLRGITSRESLRGSLPRNQPPRNHRGSLRGKSRNHVAKSLHGINSRSNFLNHFAESLLLNHFRQSNSRNHFTQYLDSWNHSQDCRALATAQHQRAHSVQSALVTQQAAAERGDDGTKTIYKTSCNALYLHQCSFSAFSRSGTSSVPDGQRLTLGKVLCAGQERIVDRLPFAAEYRRISRKRMSLEKFNEREEACRNKHCKRTFARST